MKTIKIPSGPNKLSAIINEPNKTSDKLAILCPGYLDSKDYSGLRLLAEDLAKIGYMVVRFDPTGTWYSEGAIEEYTTTQYLIDIKNVLDYMLSQDSYKHILLGGHSRGGQVSLLYAARDSRISQVLGIMPSSKLSMDRTDERQMEWERTGFSASKRDIPNSAEIVTFKVPFSHMTDRQKYDVITEVKKIQVPIILLAGEKDVLVKPEFVKAIFDSANSPKTFKILKDIGHDYRHNLDEVNQVNKEILKLINQNPA